MRFFNTTLLSTIALLSFGCDSKESTTQAQTQIPEQEIAPTMTYNLSKLSQEQNSFSFNTKANLVSGKLEVLAPQKDSEGTHVESHTTLKTLASTKTFTTSSVNTIDEFGNIIKVVSDEGLECLLTNTVEAMPTAANIGDSSTTPRKYTCNDESSYISTWKLHENENGQIVYTIDKTLTTTDGEKSSSVNFILNDKSKIVSINGEVSFAGLSYTINAK